MLKKIETSKLYHPTPVVVVVAGREKPNPSTYIYFSQVNDRPPMVFVGIKKKRFTYQLIKEYKEFTVNVVNEEILKGADISGTYTGNQVDKSNLCGFEYERGEKVDTFYIKNAPVVYEVKLMDEVELYDHNLLLGEVVLVKVSNKLINGDRFNFESANFIISSYNTLSYYSSGEELLPWGFSVKNSKT